MKVRIIEEKWGINRRTGKKSVEKTEEQIVVPRAGLQLLFTKGNRCFVINGVSESVVDISMKNKNPDFDKNWKLSLNETIKHRPRSFDGGYQYQIDLLEENEWGN